MLLCVGDGGCGRGRGMGKFTKSKVSFQFSMVCNMNFEEVVCWLTMHIIIRPLQINYLFLILPQGESTCGWVVPEVLIN